MKAVVQRVSRASVTIEGEVRSEIDQGLLTFLGVAKGDTEEQMQKMIKKIVELRVFEDDAGKMNLSLQDVGGKHLIVSQFTLLGDCSKGRRPAFVGAEAPDLAIAMYKKALEFSNSLGVETLSGEFGADMKVDLLNDGPVTMLLEF